MRALAAAAAAPVLGLMLAACGAPAPALNRSAPPVSVTPENVPSAPLTPVQNWCAGNGFNDWEAVAADLKRFHGDSASGDLAAVTGDGNQLGTDAAAAVSLPPPFSRPHTADYLYGLTALRVAGGNIASGDFTAAAKDFDLADGYLGDVGVLISRDCPGG